MTAGSFDVAVITANIEAIGNRDAIVDFTSEGRRSVALIVSQVLGVVGFAGVESALEREPVVVGRTWIDVWTCDRHLVRRGAGRNLVEVFGDAQAVSVHANVADEQAVVTHKLTLYGEIPLIGLRIAVIGIDTLIEALSPVLHAHRGRRGVGERDQWRAIRGHAVGISVQRGGRVAAVVKRERPQIGDGKDPEARADDRRG